jgi:glycosyltransferase involved in cell wall biosynthesis
VKLVFIGKGYDGDPENSEPEIRRFIASHGLGESVRLLGYQSSVQDVLQALDVACLVSYREGLPLSLIEAMSSALPVIGTDIEAIRGVVQPGSNGFLVTPDDVPALTAALDRLASDEPLRRKLGEMSRKIASEKYSLKRCVEQTEHLFRTLVSHERQPARATQTPDLQLHQHNHE